MSEKSNTIYTILIVSDNSETVNSLTASLQMSASPIIETITVRHDYAETYVVENEPPHMVLLDLPMPVASSFDICQRLKNAAHNQDLPIIVVANVSTEESLQQAFEAGAVDYLYHPIPALLLQQRVQQQLNMQDIKTALRYNQESLEMALEASEVGIWDWDMQSNETYFSRGWVNMLGYEMGDLANTFEAWKNLIHPDDFDHVQQALQKHIDRGDPYEVEHRLKTRTGGWRWVLTRGSIIERDLKGAPSRMVGTHRDITQAKMMRQALSKSEERHRIISNTISDYAYSYIVLENGSLKKDWSTQAFHDITGYTFQEVDMDGWQGLIHQDDYEIAIKRFERLLKGEKDISEFRIVTKHGDIRWLRDHGYPVVDDASGRVVHIYGAAQDITERKRYEEKLHHQTLELQARNEELDAFAYTVAHDLKNPIASMMGFASLMMNYYQRMDDEKIMEYLSLIMEGGYKLKSIINALLLLAGVNKMEEVQMEALDMETIVEGAKQRLNHMIRETNAEIILPESWPEAVGFAPWVEEVWMNYLSNALKYGGTPPCVEAGADTPNNGSVRFWVRDNGKGLTNEEQERVFTPFTRLNQVKIEGHGLGLSVVQRIVHKLGGDIGVESTLGEGSTFSFTLPAKHN